MSMIKLLNQASNVNAVANLQFSTIGPEGALLTLFASCVTAGDVISCTVGGKNIADLAQPNVEISADVVDTDRDLLFAREPVPPGDILLPITATTAVNFLLILE